MIISDILLRATDHTISEYGCNLYKQMFFFFDTYPKQVNWSFNYAFFYLFVKPKNLLVVLIKVFCAFIKQFVNIKDHIKEYWLKTLSHKYKLCTFGLIHTKKYCMIVQNPCFIWTKFLELFFHLSWWYKETFYFISQSFLKESDS